MSLEGMYNYLLDKLGAAADQILKLVLAVVVFVIARKLIIWLCDAIKKNMRKFHAEEAIISFVVSLVKYGLNILLVMTLIVQLGIVSEASIAAAIASAGVAVSLALQGGLSNFAGGLMILLLKPFKVGDYIVFPGETMEGTVKKIELYYTTLNSIDNRTIMIPNANLTNNTIINVTAMNKRKLEIKVGISYDSNFQNAKEILQRLVENEPRFFPEEQQFFVDELGSSSVVVGMRAWLGTNDYWPVKWEMNERIKQEFDQAGIIIPYQQLDVHIKEE
ncbi:MAG: mechanosensitive ion channel family protein [Fusicatenibacter sp.]|nr:mechanosensitive ion channel [Fusicatenibacter sp.]